MPKTKKRLRKQKRASGGVLYDRITEVVKYNHNHDPETGRFTSGPGGASAGGGSSGRTVPATQKQVENLQSRLKNANLWAIDTAKEHYEKSKEVYQPFQEGTANKDNFMVDTMAEFQQISGRPRRKPDYVSYDRDGNISSEYWYTEEGVIRGSKHWGENVASCDWPLKHEDGHTSYGNRDRDDVAHTSKVYGMAKWDDFTYKTKLIDIGDGNEYMCSFDTSMGKRGKSACHSINGKKYVYNKDSRKWEEIE